ncbi:MAG: hypothetical protein IJK92_00895 [Bacteroidales bacterium]|nr:hypothetical protein [Bacteroidales bacterium]
MGVSKCLRSPVSFHQQTDLPKHHPHTEYP